MRLWLRKGPFSPFVPQLWTLSVARRENWAPHCGPPRPLGGKRLLLGSRWPGSASWGRMDGTLQTVSAGPSALPTGPRGNAGGRLSSLHPEAPSQGFQLPLQVSSRSLPSCQRQFLLEASEWTGFPLCGGYWIPQPSPAAPQGAQAARWGFSVLPVRGSEP